MNPDGRVLLSGLDTSSPEKDDDTALRRADHAEGQSRAAHRVETEISLEYLSTSLSFSHPRMMLHVGVDGIKNQLDIPR